MSGPVVFLGGACGQTAWRREIAIPILEAAGVAYYDPQLPAGAWTAAREAEEMRAKDRAAVLLFVLHGETRGVATVGEIAYYLADGRSLALAVTDVTSWTGEEAEDLNRGRLFIRSMARERGIPVFVSVAEAARYAVELAAAHAGRMTPGRLRSLLAEVRFGDAAFLVEARPGGCLLWIVAEVECAVTGEPQRFEGRRWWVGAEASDDEVIATAFQAVAAWQEHEARERFTVRGKALFSPHRRWSRE